MHRVGQQLRKPSRILRLRLGHVAHPRLEVLAVGVDRPHHHLVAEYEVEVNAVGMNLDGLVAAGNAGQYQHAVLGQTLHGVEDHGGVPGRFKNDVVGTALFRTLQEWQLLGGVIVRAQGLDQVGIATGLGAAGKGVYLQSTQAEYQRRKKADCAGTHDRGGARSPHLQATLDLVGLYDAFLYDRHRLKQHRDILQSLRNLDDVLRIVHIVFSEEAVQTADATLEVLIVGGHVVGADLVVEAISRAAHRSHYVIAGFELGDIGANLFHLSEALMPNHQKLIAVGRCAV